MPTLLETRSLSKSFGGLKAVQSVSLSLEPGEIVSIIGPNGAGKTTFFNCLSGIYQPDGGQLFLNGRDCTGFPAHRIARRGLARTFQNIRLFPEMTACENVMVGQYRHRDKSAARFLLRTPRYQSEEAQARSRAHELLEFTGLGNYSREWARHLPYGLQRRLEIARALATEPQVLLLDEPGAGMNPQEIGGLLQLIGRIRERGIAVLFIEHHMKLVMEISDRILVLDHGEPIAAGTPAEVRRDERVIAAYLGKPAQET